MPLPVAAAGLPLPAPSRATAPAAASRALAAFTLVRACFIRVRACLFRPDCPAVTAAWTAFMSFSQLISCENDMETEILLDHAAPRARAPRARPRAALTVTTRHLNQRPCPLASAAGLRALSEFIIAWIVGKPAKARALRRNCAQAHGEMVTAMSVLGGHSCLSAPYASLSDVYHYGHSRYAWLLLY